MDSATRQHRSRDRACGRCAELAHDVNNFLGVLLGSCDLLEAQSGLPDQAKELIAQMHKAAISASKLSEDALRSLRQQPISPASLDLNQVVVGMQSMVERLMGRQIQLVSILSPRPAIILAATSEVEQVLMNLLMNARDAISRKGTITLEIAATSSDVAGSGFLLTVTDTGSGMNAEIQSQIFEPFFTTKQDGKGTGLGLSIVAGIVQRAGWAITVDSFPGAGTTFKVYFPNFEQNRKQGRAAVFQNASPIPPPGTETILLVEDCDSLRRLTRRLLEDCGYQVLDASSSRQALSLAGEHPGNIALLLTDLSMPGLGGRDLARKVTLMRSETRVLYMSGYEDGSLAAETKGAFLLKPFTRDDLHKKVREILDQPLPGSRPALPPKASSQNSTSRYSAHRLCG